MKTIPILAARINLDVLVRRVERGEIIVLTENGKPISELRPHRKGKTVKPEKRK